MAIDFTTDVGQVRLLISDVNEADFVFSDDEINAFLALEGDVRLGAAQALETMASNEALVFKKIRAGRLIEADGTAVAASLMERAELLRGQSNMDGSFEIADGCERLGHRCGVL